MIKLACFVLLMGDVYLLRYRISAITIAETVYVAESGHKPLVAASSPAVATTALGWAGHSQFRATALLRSEY